MDRLYKYQEDFMKSENLNEKKLPLLSPLKQMY